MTTKILLSVMGAAATVVNSAVATDIYFVENTKIAPGDINLWKTSSTSKSATKLKVLDTSGTIDVVSGAAVCGNNYLAAWDTFPSNYGLLQVDLSSQNYTHMFNEGDYLFHAVGCHPTDANVALLVGSTPKAADSSAQFSLVSFDLVTKNQTKIADFPDPREEFFQGMDASFRFEADGKTAIMAVGKEFGSSAEPHESYVYTMDTTSGQVTHTYTTKLHALFTVFDGLKRAITLDQNGQKWKLSWADMSCSGQSCFVKVTGSADEDWDGGKPFAICGDDAWDALLTGTSSSPFNHLSISDGTSTTLFDLQDVGVKGEAGGLAAVCSTQ